MTRHLSSFAIGHLPGRPFQSALVPDGVTRIFSDLHFGDRASRVDRLAQVRPLLDGIAHLVINGDALDTRPGPAPAATAALRAEVLDFFAHAVPAVTFVTGNHDADLSPHHALDLAGGAVFAVHGDILFETIVPWSTDARRLGALIRAELTALPPDRREQLTERLGAWRRAATLIPQRHQSERRAWRYLMGFLRDTVWPPLRPLRILQAWREEPARAAALLQRHRPAARFMLTGHTHRPGWWRLPGGAVLINTGSLCRPFGGFAVDLTPSHVIVRPVTAQRGEFRAGPPVVEFPLAAA
jgi:predicted phosphodiesterase